MRRRDRVPEIPPVPTVGSAATSPGVSGQKLGSQPIRQEQPALPDLLEAFWGDAAAQAAEDNTNRSASTRRRGACAHQPRNTTAARSTQRSKTTSDV